MKTKRNQLLYIIMLLSLLCINANHTYAQWVIDGGVGDRWTHTACQNPNVCIRRVGIGDFSTTLGPRAALNIDANLLLPLQPTAGNFFLPGEVFRTDGPSDRLNAWRLWTGGQNPQNPASEKFSMFVPANTPWVFLQASQPGSRLVFNTGGSNERMTITEDGFVIINSLQCDNCFVMSDKNGTLKTFDAEDLLQTIEQLKEQLAYLQEKINDISRQVNNN